MKSKLSQFRTLTILVTTMWLANATRATDVPQNLGNGLGKLVESRVAIKKGQASRTSLQSNRGFASREAASFDSMAIKDPSAPDRYIVDIHPNGRVRIDELKSQLATKFPSFKVTAVDTKYRGVGVIEGYISIDDVARVASMRGVTSVQLGLKPYIKKAKTAANVPKLLAPRAPNAPTAALTLIGTCFDQGVTQHRVDKINTVYDATAPSTWDGAGMSIGALSNSFDTRTAAPHAATAVAAFDLPGAGGNPYNTTPVTVLQDEAPGNGTDEGRGMCEILYKMAPRAKLAFATADFGAVGFANNIRALAGLAGFMYPGQTFAAQSICDDVGYFDEPWFEDGIIGAGIDDVAAAGVAYFSSASNDIGTNGYSSVLRWVPNGTGNTAAAGNTALAGTNIDLTGVPAALIAGGFHNFNPDAGQKDVAQTWAIPTGDQFFIVQWDEPYDQNTASTNDAPAIYMKDGTFAGTDVTFNDVPALTAGQLYQIDAFDTGSGGLDVIVTVRDPSNNIVVLQDHAIDETVHFYAPVSGTGYTITIGSFAGTGGFHIDLFHSTGYPNVLLATDVNILAFRIDTGAYIPSPGITVNNFATNQPIELGTITRPGGQGGVQIVIARANVPSGQAATHLRFQDGGNGAGGIGPVEYFTYNSVATGGHDTARGCNGTAAYSVFRPSRPETFTSPGAAVYYFDKMNNRLTTPEIRLQPRIAAADAGNTSFFSTTDSTSDGDTSRNFSGTSAAAPHAAAIAALVMQAHGGPGMVTPAQMSSVLQRSTYTHDLDPMFASGSATTSNGGTVAVSVNSDSSNIAAPVGTNPVLSSGLGYQDSNAWKVSYSGPGFITALTFNPTGSSATAGSPTSGNNGVDASNTYFSNVYPGVVFTPGTKAFTLGSLTTGLVAGDVAAPVFSNAAPLPSGANTWWTMALSFPNSNFTGGKALRFTVGRGQQHSAVVGTFGTPTGGAPFAGPNSGGTTSDATADLLGGSVLIPEGTVTANGMSFNGTVSDGVNTFPFSGTINNNLGTGYSTLDGYGFINAQTAVTAPLAGPAAVTLNGAVSRKNHPGAGNMDIPLPSVGNPGVECRSGGANGDFTIVFKFANSLVGVGGSTLINGTGSIASSSIQGTEYVVNLTGITDAQRVSVALIDVTDSLGNKSPSFATTMAVLLGDTTGDGAVNSADISQTKSQSGQAVGGGNFRQDVNVDGSLNSGDISLVKSQTGHALP